MTGFWEGVGALVPSVGVGLLFWFAIRSMLRADQRERSAMLRYEAAQDRAQDRAQAQAQSETQSEAQSEAQDRARAEAGAAPIDAAEGGGAAAPVVLPREGDAR